jgi:hypothetical protein
MQRDEPFCKPVERFGTERLRAVAQRVGGIVMHLDQKGRRSRSHRARGERRNQCGTAGRVTGIDDDRRCVMWRSTGTSAEVQRVSRIGFEGAHAAFAEDDVSLPEAMTYSALMSHSSYVTKDPA